jgi:hypothetical protein
MLRGTIASSGGSAYWGWRAPQKRWQESVFFLDVELRDVGKRKLCGYGYRSDREGADRNDNIAIDHHIFRYRKSNALADHRTSRTNRLCNLEVNLRTIRNHGDDLCHRSEGNRSAHKQAEVNLKVLRCIGRRLLIGLWQ